MSCQNVTMFFPKALPSFYLSNALKTENLCEIRASEILEDHLLEM